jgi:hypothetical protein
LCAVSNERPLVTTNSSLDCTSMAHLREVANVPSAS